MTVKQSMVRLALYVIAEMLIVVSTDLNSMGDATPLQWAAFIVKSALAGVVAARAYIDTSPAQIGMKLTPVDTP